MELHLHCAHAVRVAVSQHVDDTVERGPQLDRLRGGLEMLRLQLGNDQLAFHQAQQPVR